MSRCIFVLGLILSSSFVFATTIEKTSLTPRIAGTFQFLPQAALNSKSGKVLVVWQQNNGSGTPSSIWGRLLTSSGSPSGSPFLIVKGPMALRPQIVYNRQTNSFLLVYQNDLKRNQHFAIFAQRLTAKGIRKGKALRISDKGDAALPITNLSPQLVLEPSRKGFVVFWRRQALDSPANPQEGIFAKALNQDLTVRHQAVPLRPLIRDGNSLLGPFVTDLKVHPVSGKLVFAGYVVTSAQNFTWTYFVSTVDAELQKLATPPAALNSNPAGGAEFDVKLAIPEDGGNAFAVFVDRSGLQHRLLNGKTKPAGPVSAFFHSPVQNTKVEFPKVTASGEAGDSQKFVIAVEVNVVPETIWLQLVDSSGNASGEPLEIANSSDRILNPAIVRFPASTSDPLHYGVIYTEGSENFPAVPGDGSNLILLNVHFTP